jgi:hypothetical protein
MTETEKKARKQRVAEPMQLKKVDEAGIESFVAEVQDVTAAKAYIREKGLSGPFVVMDIRARLNPTATQKTIVKFT